MNYEQIWLWPGEEPWVFVDDGTIPFDFFYPEPDDGTIPLPFPEFSLAQQAIEANLDLSPGSWLKDMEFKALERMKAVPDLIIAQPVEFDIMPPAPKVKTDLYVMADKQMIEHIRRRGNIWGPGNTKHWDAIKDEKEVRQKIHIMATEPHNPKGCVNDNNVIFFTQTVYNRSPLKREALVQAFMDNLSGG